MANRRLSRKLAVLILLLIPSFVYSQKTIKGEVIGVSDGDTITVLEGRIPFKVRLLGIDAPEKKQAYGEHCKQALSGIVFGKQVKVEYRKLDRYRRVLGKVLIDGRDVNLAQLECGCAWYYRQYRRDLAPADQAKYAEAEAVARENERGLWNDRRAIPPWDFRRPRKGVQN